MTMKYEIDSLLDKKVFPAVSIILPIHPQFPDIKLDSEHMISVLKNIENQLNGRYGLKRTELMIQKVKKVISTIETKHLLKSLLIYVSPETEKVISLPYSVEEKIVIDSSFEVRDLIFAAQKNEKYLLVIISQKSVKTFNGNLFELKPIEFPDMPANVQDVSNEHSFPGLDYLDSKAFDEKNLHNYLRFIDDVLEKSLKQNDIPVVIMGNVKILGYFRRFTQNTKRIIGYVEGNYEHLSLPEIRSKAETIIQNRIFEGEERAISELQEAVNANKYNAGITEVWRSAVEGKGRLLLVEKDYSVRARRGVDEYTIYPDNSETNLHNVLSDAVDDIIELILKKNGEVVFVANGKLKSFERIALINRY